MQGFAQACKSPINRPLSFLCLALCCTVLRSRWYQSGINRGIAPSQSCSLAHPSEVHPQHLTGPPVSSLPWIATGTTGSLGGPQHGRRHGLGLRPATLRLPVSAKTYAGNVRGRLPVYPLWQWSIRDPAYRFSTTIYGRRSPGVDSLRSEPLAVLRRCPMHDPVFRLRRISKTSTAVSASRCARFRSG